jgi:hypothetical protein
MRLLIIFLIITYTLFSQAQEAYKNCSYTKFKNGKVATSTCYNEDRYRGISTAYNLKGEKIGEWSLSRMHQLSSVHFSFHSNGGVYKAEYSSHPDAGIQWYRNVTTYNEQGEKIHFWEQSHDDRTTIMEPTFQQHTVEPIKVPSKPETIACAILYISELWIDNRLSQNIKVIWASKIHKEQKGSITISKGKKAKVVEWLMAEIYETPMPYFDINVVSTSGKKIKESVLSNQPLVDERRLKDNRKGFIYEIEAK